MAWPRRLVAGLALAGAAGAWYHKGEVLRQKSDSSDRPFMSEWNFVRTFVSFFTSALRKSVRLRRCAGSAGAGSAGAGSAARAGATPAHAGAGAGREPGRTAEGATYDAESMVAGERAAGAGAASVEGVARLATA